MHSLLAEAYRHQYAACHRPASNSTDAVCAADSRARTNSIVRTVFAGTSSMLRLLFASQSPAIDRSVAHDFLRMGNMVRSAAPDSVVRVSDINWICQCCRKQNKSLSMNATDDHPFGRADAALILWPNVLLVSNQLNHLLIHSLYRPSPFP